MLAMTSILQRLRSLVHGRSRRSVLDMPQLSSSARGVQETSHRPGLDEVVVAIHRRA